MLRPAARGRQLRGRSARREVVQRTARYLSGLAAMAPRWGLEFQSSEIENAGGTRVTTRAPSLLQVVVTIAVCATGGCSWPTGNGCHGYRTPADQTGRVIITQGIAGNVWEWVGDFGSTAPCGTVMPVARTLLVYPLTAVAAVPGLGPQDYFVSAFPGSPIDSVRSDTTGFFELTLPPGSYSVILRQGARLYVRVGTLNIANIGQVDVSTGSVRLMQATINDRASF